MPYMFDTFLQQRADHKNRETVEYAATNCTLLLLAVGCSALHCQRRDFASFR